MNEFFQHETAIIEDGCSIGQGVKVWVNAQIRSGAKLGDNSVISKDVFVDADVEIGRGCKIQNGVSIYKGVTIGDDVFVGPNTTFTNDKIPRAFNTEWSIVNTTICNGASLGANSTIVCGITVGEYAMVAAGAVVTKDVEPFALVMGNPAKVVGKVDKLGNRVLDGE